VHYHCEACGADIAFIRLAGSPTVRRCGSCERIG
jgi:RNA polymerase-binding transcription factor DksA